MSQHRLSLKNYKTTISIFFSLFWPDYFIFCGVLWFFLTSYCSQFSPSHFLFDSPRLVPSCKQFLLYWKQYQTYYRAAGLACINLRIASHQFGEEAEG